MARAYKSRISGIGRIPVTRDLPATLLEVYRLVAAEAIADAGVDHKEIDGIFVTPSALSGEPWMMFAANLGEYLGLSTRRLGMFENGGCSSFVALQAAIDAVEAGACKVALVIAADTRPDFDMSNFEVFIRNSVFTQTGLHGITNGMYGVGAPIPYYAMSHQRYMHEYGVTAEQVALAPVRLREHAAKCEYAQFKEPITVDDVLNARQLSPPITLMQSSSVSSGACAVVVTSAEIGGDDARDVAVTGRGEYHTANHFLPVRDTYTTYKSVVEAGRQAYEEAGIKPEDVDIAEVYGVFAATELILYEDLGFFPKGEAAAAVADGKTTFGAQTVFNPSGGRLSFGHPAGATPLYEVAEVVSQLRGEAGANQVEGASIGLTQAEHGMMNGATVLIFGSN